MASRRIVTGHNARGEAVIASDQVIDPQEMMLFPGGQFTILYGSDAAPVHDPSGALPPFTRFFPPPGGVRVNTAIFPVETAGPSPMESMSQEEVAAFMEQGMAEAETKFPGLMDVMEPDSPGFHTTDTIDIVYIAEGKVELSVTEGAPVVLDAGSFVVQNGTRHAWRNVGDVPVKLVAFLVGVNR